MVGREKGALDASARVQPRMSPPDQPTVNQLKINYFAHRAENAWAVVSRQFSRPTRLAEGFTGYRRGCARQAVEPQAFLLEFRRPQVRHVEANHDLRSLVEPRAGRRAGSLDPWR
jgi:hypothetical protein